MLLLRDKGNLSHLFPFLNGADPTNFEPTACRMPKQKILLVYIGNEQGSWGAVAYPRPVHYYIMPGILYCAQSLTLDPWVLDNFEIICRFFNATVEPREEIIDAILEYGASFIGFSLFCWNARDTLWLVREIKNRIPDCSIAGGGPEASLKNHDEAAAFFSENPGFDMLVFGEAELTIAPLVKSLMTRSAPPPPQVTGYAFSPRLGGSAEFTKGYIDDPERIPSIYPFVFDVKRSPDCGLAMVYETGRGCPYRCIYCQFSHRNHKPFRFSPERVKRELAWLFGRGMECIHFADAVFDLDPAYAKDILAACVRLNRRTSLFFYCSFFRLDDELARLFALSQAQLCVGVQSTNPSVLAKINRTLSPRLFHDIRDILKKHHLNFYIDLIFGLPLDGMDSFRRSFAESLMIGPSFMMVFPLTLINGTPIEQHSDDYGIRAYPQSDIDNCGLMCGIEYKNIALYRDFSLADLSDFDDLALALFYFFVRFRLSLSYLEMRCGPDTARLYQRIGKKTKSFLKKTGIFATNTNFISGFEDEIKALFLSEAVSAGAGDRERAAFEELFKLDIVRILISSAPKREKMFLQSVDRHPSPQATGIQPISEESLLLRTAPGKALNSSFRLSDLRQLHVLKETIIPINDVVYISAPFCRWDVLVFSLSPFEKFILDTIPADRPIKLHQLVKSVKRAHVAADDVSDVESEVCKTVAMLMERDIIKV
jgi:radical SAM superfamily enzyme YgiQ (UPF0313 family)